MISLLITTIILLVVFDHMTLLQSGGSNRVSNMATIHTTLGDIQIKLFHD